MELFKKATVITVVFGVLAAAPASYAEDATSPADKDALHRSYVSNQWALSQVQKQYEILKSSSDLGQDSQDKLKKMEKLKNKAQLLIRDNEAILVKLEKFKAPEPAQRTYLIGSDWLVMSQEEKTHYTDLMMEAFEDQGVAFLKSADEHVEALGNMFISDVTLLDKPLNNVFVLEIFKSEPRSRQAIKQLYGNVA